MMKKFLISMFICGLFAAPLFADPVPAPKDDGVRHIIQIPAGGLKEFLGWRAARVPMISHHRAGPVPGYPENAIETMDNALKYGPGFMEVDVVQLADGNLILMHDRTLNRTTTGSGDVANKKWPYIKTLFLKDENMAVTNFRVPLFEDVLRWAKGRAILTLDIKPGTDFRRVAAAVKKAGAQDYAAAIAYSLEQALSFHAIAPGMPITVTMRSEKDINTVLASGIPPSHIVAWTGTKELSPQFYKRLHGNGWRVMMGTLGAGAGSIDNQIAANDNDARYLELYNKGVDVIATDRFWAVQNQITNPNLYFFVQKDVVQKARDGR